MTFRRRKNPAAIPRTVPSFEHIVTEASDSFLWRLDDYPWAVSYTHLTLPTIYSV